MIHAHYKGLATKKEAKAWFAVKPAKGSAAEKILHVPGLAEPVPLREASR